jgi:hypothetical protein
MSSVGENVLQQMCIIFAFTGQVAAVVAGAHDDKHLVLPRKPIQQARKWACLAKEGSASVANR